MLSSCKKENPDSTPVEFLSQDIQVYAFTEPSYLKVVNTDGSYQYFPDVIPDTLGFAWDTINKFIDIHGNLVDTLWVTKDYIPANTDTTSEGYRAVFIPIEKYNRGKIGLPFSFNHQVANAISSPGSLDIAGSYKKGTTSYTISKITEGTFLINKAYVLSGIPQANVIYVNSDNTLTMPPQMTGFSWGSDGALAEVETFYYNLSYALKNATVGTGDTLNFTAKRTSRAAAVNKLIRL